MKRNAEKKILQQMDSQAMPTSLMFSGNRPTARMPVGEEQVRSSRTVSFSQTRKRRAPDNRDMAHERKVLRHERECEMRERDECRRSEYERDDCRRSEHDDCRRSEYERDDCRRNECHDDKKACAKPKGQWRTLVFGILIFFVVAALCWFILYFWQPSFVIDVETDGLDYFRALFCALIIALIVIVIIGVVYALVSKRH